MFDYNEFTTRNIGFVTPEQQAKLKAAKIFIPGVGGMGGAALACLARAGVEKFVIADLDVFETSNLNRQIFADQDSIGKPKVESSVKALKAINPDIKIETYGTEWTDHLDKILSEVDLVINGCDDSRATVQLMRKAQQKKITVIDAFASTLPNIYVVRPEAPRPEKTFSYPTQGRDLSSLTEQEWGMCMEKEVEYVLTHSNTSNHVELDIAAEMVSGARSRISFAPMVWMTGCLMSYEAVKIVLGMKSVADHRGVFINPWTYKVEKPFGFIIASLRRFLVRRFLKSLLTKTQASELDMRRLNA